MALHNATMTRFLAAGYVTVMSTWSAPVERLAAALSSTLAIVDRVKNMSDVDPASVVLYGCSIGGSMVLKVAAETEVAAITAEEPGPGFGYDSVTALLGNDPSAWSRMLEDPHRLFTPAVRALAQERLRKISGPIFLAQGGSLQWQKLQNEIMFPDLKAAGKEVEAITYPRQRHCFGFFARGLENDEDAIASRFFTDMDSFFKRHLRTQPVPVDDSLADKVVPSGSVLERIPRIELASEILAGYVGTYEPLVVTSGLGSEDVVVTLKDNQLMVEITTFGPRAKGPFFAASQTDFFADPMRPGRPELEFVKGEDGTVTHLILRPFNQTFRKQAAP
jgi:dienelactone hydrolase